MKNKQLNWISFNFFFLFFFLSCQEDTKTLNSTSSLNSLQAPSSQSKGDVNFEKGASSSKNAEDFSEFSAKKESCADPAKNAEEPPKMESVQEVPSLQGGNTGCSAH